MRFVMSLSGFLIGRNISQYTIIYLIKQIMKSFLQRGKMWQFWYMGSLIIIYVLLILINYLNSRVRMSEEKKSHFVIVLWCITLICSVAIHFCSIIYREALQQHVIQTFRLWSWLQYFILGGMMPHIWPITVKKIPVKMHIILLCISSAFVVCYQYIMGKCILNNTYAEYFYDSILLIGWVSILFTFMLRMNIPAMWTKYIPKLASLTLGVYIVHPMVITIISKCICPSTWIGAICNFAIVLILSFAITLIMGVVNFMKRWFLTL